MIKHHFVYITTNLINGRQYVGDHSTNNLNDHYLGSGSIIRNAIKKYGRINFKKEILKQFKTKQKAFDAQEKYIKEYDTLVPNGYNISPKGGHNVKGCWSEESKRKIGKSNSGEKNGMFGKTHTEDAKMKVSKANKGEKNGFYGKTHTKYVKEIIRQVNLGKKDTKETKKKRSIAVFGERNSMYGLFGIDNPNFGSKRSEESKRKMRGRIKSKEERLKISNANKNRPKITCEYCGKILDNMNYKKWHGNNCKKNIKI